MIAADLANAVRAIIDERHRRLDAQLLDALSRWVSGCEPAYVFGRSTRPAGDFSLRLPDLGDQFLGLGLAGDLSECPEIYIEARP